MEFAEIPIKDIPLYSRDYDSDFPAEARALYHCDHDPDAAKVLLRDRRAELPGRCADHADGFRDNEFVPHTTGDELLREMDALKARLDVFRNELSIFAAADEDEQVAAWVVELEMALFSTHNSVALYVTELVRPSENQHFDAYRYAMWHHDRALVLVGIVRALVAGRHDAALEERLRELKEAAPVISEPPGAETDDGEGDASWG
jgi:hypothetical protein